VAVSRMGIDMRRALIVLGALVALAAAGVAAQAPPAQADANYRVPRTPWGDPRNTLTAEEFTARQSNFEEQEELDNADFDLENADSTPGGGVGGPVSPPPHWLERGRPQFQASLIVDPPDGRTPPLTTEAQARQAAQRDERQGRGPADSYIDRSLYDRCISRGIAGSILPVIYNNGNEIVQAPGFVAIRNEMIHETRVVPLDGRSRASPDIKLWMGDSRGRWEGDTLVVETKNLGSFAPGIGVNGGGLRHSDDVTLTERFSRLNDDTLVYSMTVDDPNTWERPWTMQYPLRRDDDYGFYEYACHEGNYSLFNILSGARAGDQAAAAEAGR